MATKSFEIQVHDDHLQRIAQVRKPILAVAELIWNAVDADADRVDVILEEDPLGGLAAIEVSDNGHGIPYLEAENLFSRLGGSWKKTEHHSQEKRRHLHGKEGRGRFRAFSLGRVVDWHVNYVANGNLRSYQIAMIKDQLRRVEVGEESDAITSQRGVSVRVSELDKNFKSLRDPTITDELAQIFALYLRKYPNIHIYYSRTRIDPHSVEEHAKEYPLPAITDEDGQVYEAKLEIVEWKMSGERRMYFCDASGFPLDDTSPGIQAPGVTFTVYLKSDYFAKLLNENRLEIANLDTPTSAILNVAKELMRDHFRRRASEKAVGLVEEWQREKVYPYEGTPVSAVEASERQVFDVVALNVNHYLPTFQASDEKSKRLQLRLLKHAVEHASSDLSKILTEVLGLPEDKRQELSALLDRTTLSHIIGASKIISDRLEFLQGIETLVFDAEFKHAVRERTQLHRILAENSWMFGEQYHLSVDDQSLTEVLKKHIDAKKRDILIDGPVKRADGSVGIVDLMFSRNIQLAGTEDREHLVVELKRPDVKIDTDAINQIESYAFAVADDERFLNVNAKWVFWAVSTNMDSTVNRKVNQKDRPRGMLYQDEGQRVTIWVKTWSQIFNDCRSRLRFFAEKLNYTPDRDSSLEYLKTTYHKYLSDLFPNQPEDDASTGK